MPTQSFSWLHLTDFHFGLDGQKFLWPNLRQPFLDDLAVLHEKTGPWDAVLFTGDLVQQGKSDEFKEMQKEVLDRLWEKLSELGSGNAVLLAVPGNHDLYRPKKGTGAVDMLLLEGGFGNISELFWKDPNSEYRRVINDAFSPYNEWWKTAAHRSKDLTTGILPGDFACTLKCGEQSIGIVGLNTAFMQLQGGDYKGKLVWDVRQLQAVCGGAVDDWLKRHTLCLLLTHQGPDWLTSASKNHGESEIVPAGRFAVHLFGHMHETGIQYIRTGGNPSAIRLCQGCSVFGMEMFGEPPSLVRSHGYAVSKIEFQQEQVILRIWPRIATDEPKGNGWRYIPDNTHAILQADHGTAPESLTQPSQRNNLPPVIELKPDPIPAPPAFYAEPPYISSHKFVGRQSQLEILSDWAKPSDSHSILIFEAIGGTGKSILTWEWATKHSSTTRTDWAGKFWYSFYERGATMTEFCRRALAYMTGKPRDSFKKKNTTELSELIIHQLQAKPWMIILDGLERILVTYHRFDAAQIRDEDAGKTDEIAHRDPCAAINPEDEELLRALAGASPSKLLISTRLVPRVLLNKSNQPIPGVLRETLPGLRPADAEELIRSCGVTGTSLNIQNYLQSHCDCHPLVVGVLAGLINDYLPARGNFDAWAIAPDGGERLNLAKLDLVQKRNNILAAAFAALKDSSRQLLSTLALLTGSVDYLTLCALNPKLPSLPEAVPQPKKIKKNAVWQKLSEAEQQKAQERYLVMDKRRKEFEQAMARRDEEINLAAGDLASIVKDLEQRGLLQYDAITKRYDLHPVVRGVAVGGLKVEEKNRFGRRVVDHFSLQAQDPYYQAETLDEFDNARHIVKVFFHMGRKVDAYLFLNRNPTFIEALNSKFEAHHEILTIIRPFFLDGWSVIPDYLVKIDGVNLANKAAVSLRRIGALQDAFEISITVLRTIISKYASPYPGLLTPLMSMASTAGEQNHLALEDRLLSLTKFFARLNHKGGEKYGLARFRQLSMLGRWKEATDLTSVISPEHSAIGAHHYVVHLYQCGKLTEQEIAKAEELNRSNKSALGIRNLCALRGYWLLEQGEFALAKKSLQEAVALARKASKIDRRAEICLAIAQHNLGELADPDNFAEQFIYDLQDPCHHALANLWLAIGNNEMAKNHAISAYKWAWADGTPFVRYSELVKVTALLEQLGVAPPVLPAYDPNKDKKYEWESGIERIIQRLGKSSH